MNLYERLVSKVKLNESGCWIWQGSLLKSGGYGQISVDGKPCRAHVVAYECLTGEVPHGTELDHLCRTPACINPSHLEAVSHRENLLRAPSSIPAINAAKTHCAKGHEFNESNTYKTKFNQRYCRACNRERMQLARASR